jgi:hypothetical protein
MQTVIGKTSSSNQDKNDCTVRCLANLTDLTYDDAKELLASARKSDKRGASASSFVPLYRDLGIRPVATFGTTNQAVWMEHLFPNKFKGMTVNSFMQRCNKNRSYAIMVKGHIFAVVNGVIHDKVSWDTLRNMRVTAYFVKEN